jgi:LDH2 family malate/lactate/ureidoglycolate dehydrogenase
MVQVFKKVGVPEEDAKICAEILMESDRRGIESHGVRSFAAS